MSGEGKNIAVLRTTPIFEGLAFSDLEKIELIVYKRTFMPGETIVYKRQPGEGMYIIKKGLIELTKTVDGEGIEIGGTERRRVFWRDVLIGGVSTLCRGGSG